MVRAENKGWKWKEKRSSSVLGWKDRHFPSSYLWGEWIYLLPSNCLIPLVLFIGNILLVLFSLFIIIIFFGQAEGENDLLGKSSCWSSLVLHIEAAKRSRYSFSFHSPLLMKFWALLETWELSAGRCNKSGVCRLTSVWYLDICLSQGNLNGTKGEGS